MLVTHMRKGVPKKMNRTTKKKEKRRKSINTGMILAFFGALMAGETVRLPICIVPKMSCTMSVRIEFETMDGEIRAEPLEHAVFTVPYYEGNMERYIDGLKLDWEDGDGNKIVYFPFEKVTAIPPKK